MTDHDVQIYQKAEDVIIVIHVPAARREQKPVYVDGDMFKGTYRRNWEGDYHCTHEDIYAVWENQGWIAPQVIEEYSPDRTILKLSFIDEMSKKVTEKSDRKKVTEKTKSQMTTIIEKMQPDTEYKVEEVSEWLNVGRSRTRTLLKTLVLEGTILETGVTKMKRYKRRK